jgi:hypothetical protein
MDPNNPRPPQQRGTGMGISTVQKWVMTIVVVGVVGLHATAMAAAPLAFNSHAPGAKPGLLIISGFFGMSAVVAAQLIHKRSAFTPLLILGWIPAAAFAIVYYG